MKILLVDVDSKIPNIALMKISTFYKKQGYSVDLMKLGFSYYPHNMIQLIDAFEYNFVFVSIIFKINKDRIRVSNSNVEFGGVGYSLDKDLPSYIEECEPDYSIYPDNDTSYGYLTRGCIRKCEFCVVPKKEGMIRKVANIDDILKHKKIKFLDNNILAFKDHIDILEELVDRNIRCQFNQGLDIKLLNPINANLISKLNYMQNFIFAFDNIDDEEIIQEKLDLFKEYEKRDWKIKFFLYCHPNMDLRGNIIYRIKWCLKNKVLPYLMRDQECWTSLYSNFFKDLAAWCNQPSLVKNMKFEEFMSKRTNTQKRIQSSIKIWSDHNEYISCM